MNLRYLLKKKKMIVCASIGIASILYQHGKTLHATFKIPLSLDKKSDTCNIFKEKHKKLIKLIQECKFIIWDEVWVLSNKVMHCLDISLRDITGIDEPFGGIILLHNNLNKIIKNEFECILVDFVVY